MKRWILRGMPPGDPEESVSFPRLGMSTERQARLAERLGVPAAVVELLERRGVSTPDDMNVFLSPLLRQLAPPEHWPGLLEAVDVLAKAILQGREVLVWGDYDVDGVTGSTLCMEVLRHHGVAAQVHLPDRQTEGYGLNTETLERLHAACTNKVGQVLLTVDCGISDVEPVARARALGYVVVVSDHHLPPEILPDAHAICNPRLHENSPCPYLAGVGVAFFVMAALNRRLAEAWGTAPLDMRRVLDLVALGTLADMVSLTGQNRILAKNGLLCLSEAVRPGLAELKNVSGYSRMAALGAGQVVFSLAPRINAAGRVGSAMDAFRLLSGQAGDVCASLAQRLDKLNAERRAEEEQIVTEAKAQADELLERRPDLTALVLYRPDWHPGIIGIVASRLVEAFYRPVLVLCRIGTDEQGVDILKGSGRSIQEFDLHAGLSACSELFLGFGGHRQAAGLSMKGDRLEALRQRFHEVVCATVGAEPVRPSLVVDGELPFALAADFSFLKAVELLQPFGVGNPEPVFVSTPLIVRSIRSFGPKREHLTLRVEEAESGISLQAKLWRKAASFPDMHTGQQVRLAFSPCINTYNGVASVELTVRDWSLL